MITLKNFINKHKRGIFATSTLAGASYLIANYATSKIKEIQENATAERLAKENLKRRFQQNQSDCVFTVSSLLPTLGEQILNELDIEAEWAKLQKSRDLEKKLKGPVEDSVNLETSITDLSISSRSEENDTLLGVLDKKQKQMIWEDIKTKSFVRVFTTLYCITLLTLLSHIQLNLLGRFTYMWSVSALNKDEPAIRLQQENQHADEGYLNPQVERMFLSSSWWLLHRGWKKCSQRVQMAVNEVVSSISLKSSLNYYDTQEMLYKIRERIEYEDSIPISYRDWMLPDTREEELEYLEGAGFEADNKTSAITLRRLLDETKDYIDSPDFQQVLNSCLNEMFAIFNQCTFANLLIPNQETVRIKEVSDVEAQAIEQGKKLTLAKILPIISRQANIIISGNEYLNGFTYIKELQAFSAMIYTQYEQELDALK